MLVKLKLGLLCLAAAVLAACGDGSGSASPELANASASASVPSDTLIVRSASGDTRTVSLSADAYTPSPSSKPFAKAAQAIVALRPAAALVDIGAPSQAKVSILRQKQEDRAIGVPLQVGFARAVPATSDTASTANLLAWSTTATGGKVAALELKSLTATGLRIGVLVKSLPAEALLRFYAADASKVTQATGKEINQALQTNLDAGDTSANARTYWSPMLKGERGILEIELPAGVDPTQLEISIPSISHGFIEPFSKTLSSSSIGNQAKGIGESGSCEKNVSCETPLPPVSNAVAYMSYVDKAASFECTGTLINDTANSGIPYFLTANHCISNQTAATSLNTIWFAKSSACNTSTLSIDAKLLETGATLLWSRSATSGTNGVGPVGTDTSFLRLNSQPPAGAMYAGWTAAAQTISNNSYATLHHPIGDLQKISKGTINNYGYTPGFNSVGGFSVFTNNSSTKNLLPLYSVSWSSGVTEGGSSGAGLFSDYTTPNPKIVGQLLGGASSCTSPFSNDYYGRFDIAYQEALNTWLSPNLSPVYRFYNSASKSYFMTNSVVEKNAIRASYPQFIYEGFSFFASPATDTNLSPVYRFRNLLNGSYLWTSSSVERAVIAQNYSNVFVQENIAWYSRLDASPGWSPLYRFRDITNGTYLFTASDIERSSILQNYAARFVEEGIAYYVKNTP